VIRLQISLRNVLWITALLAVALGWLADRRQLQAQIKNAEEVAYTMGRDLEIMRDSHAAIIAELEARSGR
jgi:hypothetical protein